MYRVIQADTGVEQWELDASPGMLRLCYKYLQPLAEAWCRMGSQSLLILHQDCQEPILGSNLRQCHFITCSFFLLSPADGKTNQWGLMMQVLEIAEGKCQIRYEGPPSISNGVVAAIKAQFPDIKDVVLVE